MSIRCFDSEAHVRVLQVRRIKCYNLRVDMLFEAKKRLQENRRTSGEYQYTLPSPHTYPYQWLWDSCFHAITLSHFSPLDAKKELVSLVSKQFDNGLLPHMIYWVRDNAHNINWGREDTSTITQPPILAYAMLEVYRKAPDVAFLEAVYPPALRYYKYLLAERDPLDHNLVGIINPDESGEDDSPRFDASLGVSTDASKESLIYHRHRLVDLNRACNFNVGMCMAQHFWVCDVPFNSFLVENLRLLARMASILGRDDDEQFCISHADLVAQAMREYMFADGVFWSVMNADHQKIRTATWAHFAPLFAGLYTAEEAKVVVRTHLHDETTFRAPCGIRTVSKKEPSYRPDGFWRGPIWFAPHWFVYKGLVRYGFSKDAAWIRDASTRLLEREGFREYYNPETGEGYGAREFTWGALVLDMVPV